MVDHAIKPFHKMQCSDFFFFFKKVKEEKTSSFLSCSHITTLCFIVLFPYGPQNSNLFKREPWASARHSFFLFRCEQGSPHGDGNHSHPSKGKRVDQKEAYVKLAQFATSSREILWANNGNHHSHQKCARGPQCIFYHICPRTMKRHGSNLWSRPLRFDQWKIL